MEHGKRWTFVKYKCRCAACCAANDTYMVDYRQRNKAKILAKEKERYQRQKDQIIERVRAYYQREAEAIMARHQLEPAKRKRADAEQRRRARKSDAEFVEDVLAAAVRARDKDLCGICGKSIRPGGSYHLDHLWPLSRGGQHTFRNVQMAHPKCNERKHARLPTIEELERF